MRVSSDKNLYIDTILAKTVPTIRSWELKAKNRSLKLLN